MKSNQITSFHLNNTNELYALPKLEKTFNQKFLSAPRLTKFLGEDILMNSIHNQQQ